MTYLAILILMALAAAVVSRPIFTGVRTVQPEGDAPPWDDLAGQRDAAYRAVKELEYEYQLGNLSDSDYRELRDRYRTRAAAILQELDTALKNAPGSAVPGDGAPSSPAPARTNARAAAMCTYCDRPIGPADAYCWNCGASVGVRCRACGSPLEVADRFCAACGTRLAEA